MFDRLLVQDSQIINISQESNISRNCFVLSLYSTFQWNAGCIAIFHKYCCHTKYGGTKTNLTLRNHWGMLLMCQNTTMRVYGAWVKTYNVLCPKTYSSFGNVSLSIASSRQAARSARMSETDLSIENCERDGKSGHEDNRVAERKQ